MNDEEMLAMLWEEDGPPTLEGENDFLIIDGQIYLINRGGSVSLFKPDPDLELTIEGLL